MVILLTTGMAFGLSFFILGQNQMNFDNIGAGELVLYPMKYDTLPGALWYVIDMFLGNLSWNQFELGNKGNKLMLYSVFCLSTFIIMIHLLNMLIAIMNNTFSENNEVADQLKYKDHLKFVLDNWFLLPYVFNKKGKNCKYLITAFSNKDDDEDGLERIQKMLHKLAYIETTVMHSNRTTQQSINQIQELVSNLSRRQDLGEPEFKRINDMIKGLERD